VLETLLLAAQLVTCDSAGTAAVMEARAKGEAFDLGGALEAARAGTGCDEAEGTVEYLEGLVAARAAVKTGGATDSLRDVRSAANALSRRAEGGNRRWEVASLLIRAAGAATQYERDEMAVYLAEAVRIEGLLLDAQQPAPPIVTAHELAGELWLQVDRYEDARQAYLRAADRVGRTGRVHLGLARSAARLNDTPIACREYTWLLEWWGERPGLPPEIEEARTLLRSGLCPSP
jgi:hypothetical protein